MKIILCDNRLGGLIGFRGDVINHLIKKGHEVTLVAPSAKTDWDKVGNQNMNDVNIKNVSMHPNSLNPVWDMILFLQYFSLFRKERPDIVINYTIKPNIYSSFAASLNNCKIICMVAGLGYMFKGNSILKKIGRWLYKKGLSNAKNVFTLNQKNYQILIQQKIVEPKKLILLSGGEGINLSKYKFTNSDFSSKTTFLMISRILYDKGYSEFVEAAKIIKRKYKDSVSFELLGPTAYDSPMGVSKEEFEKDINSDIVKYLGVTNNVPSYLGRADVVMVLPSYHEGLSRSLMEACAMGRPVIASNIPGCKETVEDGKNGYLIEPKSSDSLVNKIEEFLKLDETKKREMGIQSRNIAELKFDVNDVIKEYDNIIESLHD